MDKVTLKATARDQKSTAKQLRRAGTVPCVVYGNADNAQLQCSHVDLRQAYVKAGESTLVNLDVDGKTVPVLFHQMAFDPVTGAFSHVDFYAVDMNKEVETEVALHFEGESLAVKEGGILVTPISHLNIRCLPKDLPHNLPVSLESLAEMHSAITIKDVKVPAGVTVLDDLELVVATVQEPRKEEEVVAAAPAADGAAPAAGAPAAEGAAPAAKKEEKK